MGNYFLKLDNHGGYTFTSSKKSRLGKKEAPLPVTFFGGGANGVIHVVPEKKYAYFGGARCCASPATSRMSCSWAQRWRRSSRRKRSIRYRDPHKMSSFRRQ